MTKALKTTANTLVFAVLVLICGGFLALRLSGLGTYVVTGGSMEPTIHKGSLVLVQPVAPSDVRVGDVITFVQYDQTTTHRVIAITTSANGNLQFKTKGDANVAADPEDKIFPGQVGVARAAVPAAGYAIANVQVYWRLALTLIAALTFFSCAAALVFRREPVAAPVLAPRRVVPATLVIDADEAWDAHLAWLSRSQQRRMRVA